MFEYIHGKITELSPTYVIIEAAGVGYFIHISLYASSKLQGLTDGKVFVHHVLREDASLLYGFFAKKEREVFRLLISVSGVGANTARMILSSLSAEELAAAITSGNAATLKGVKGIGAKTAERIIIDLRDKITKVVAISETSGVGLAQSSPQQDEALAALESLGFVKKDAERMLKQIMQTANPPTTTEDLVKQVLRQR